jgi:L-ribulose-5-phosphate 3-epimerase
MGDHKLRLGVIVGLGDDPEPHLRQVADFGLPTCQIAAWNPASYTDDGARALAAAAKGAGVEITTIWAGWPGPAVWDLVQGPKTIGLVPPDRRAERTDALCRAADFAAAAGVASITTHAGFIPEDPNDPNYGGTIEALCTIAQRCQERGIGFNFETGQETPVTLLRTIHDIGTDNLGINLDPANLLMYGKGNPVDALDVFGRYVRGVHAKDGEYPTDPYQLGVEKRLGDGRVNFPALVGKLKSLGYAGALTIEREISGDQQAVDIRYAIDLLTPLL